MQNISHKIPSHWSYDFLNSLDYDSRPKWDKPDKHLYPRDLVHYCLEAGATKEDPKGWAWHFLNDVEYEKQGYDKNIDFGIEYEFWWISKIKPGCLMPVHQDFTEVHNKIRYWIPLQDWMLGHTFFSEDGKIIKYKKGDVHKFDETFFHSAGNHTKISKFALQLVAGK